MKIKLLHVCRTYFPDSHGGVEEAIRQISTSVSGIAVSVETKIFALSINPQPSEIVKPEALVVRCLSLAAPASCDLGGISTFRRFAELAEWADVIHYHFPWPFADLLHLLIRPKAPAVMTYHSDIVRQRWLGRAYAPLMHFMLKSMDAIVATSPAYATTSPMLSNPAHRDRVRVIPLGIDEHTYPHHGDDRILQRLGIAVDEPFFMFIGVMRYYKGLHTLLEACGQVNARVVIAGTGPKHAELQQQAQDLGLKNVIFAGQVTDAEKMSLLKQCLALVLPSHLRSEAFGMVLVEAAMCGKPMVSCEIGTGTSFVNLDGQTGFVVPPESPQDMAERLNLLLSDRALTERLARAARLRYESHFSGPALGRAHVQLYKEVLSAR